MAQAEEVYTIEIIEVLSLGAQSVLNNLGHKNIIYKVGDGYNAWAEHAPFDKIILSAASPEIPNILISQLKD